MRGSDTDLHLELGSRARLRGRPVRIGPLRTHSTSLVSGLIFIGIGVLFVATDGTSNLGGLAGVDSQFALQAWLQWVTARLPDTAVLLALVLLALAVAAGRLLKRSQRASAPHDPRTAATRRSPTAWRAGLGTGEGGSDRPPSGDRHPVRPAVVRMT